MSTRLLGLVRESLVADINAYDEKQRLNFRVVGEAEPPLINPQHLLALLPQGADSGLDADMVDGKHAQDIIEDIRQASAGGAGGSSGGMAQHGNEFHTPDMEEYGKIKGKTVDDSAIGNDKVLTYKTASGNIEYATPAGSGDMTKAVYDINDNSIVDNSEKLEGSTKAEVQDHTPKAHTLASHSTKAHSELTGVGPNDHHAESHTLASHSTKAHDELTGVTSDQHHAQSHSHASHTGTAKVITTLSFAVTGTLTTGTDKAPTIVAPCALTIVKVKVVVKTAPTGATLIVDVNKAGTTIFTTQGNRPEIAIGETQDDSGTPDVTALAEGDKVTVDIDQVGSTIAGADLTVEVVCEQEVVLT